MKHDITFRRHILRFENDVLNMIYFIQHSIKILSYDKLIEFGHSKVSSDPAVVQIQIINLTIKEYDHSFAQYISLESSVHDLLEWRDTVTVDAAVVKHVRTLQSSSNFRS